MNKMTANANMQAIQAALANYDTSFLSDDEEDYCPLCIEPMDITDKNFKPCPCGYQICQFCYNNIRQNPELNGRCPACRRKYDDESVEYVVLSPEELKMEQAKQARKERDRKLRDKERKENEYANRKHLAGMRVIQKNLVYVVGLNPPVPYEEVASLLKSEKYFGQYGKINKIVVNKKTAHSDHHGGSHAHHHHTGYGIYVTFAKKDDAAKCIAAVDGTYMDGRLVKAAYGTTKYCSSYLRGQSCPNPNCMFLHEPGEEADSFNRRELSSKQHDHSIPRQSSSASGLPFKPAGTSTTPFATSAASSPVPAKTHLNQTEEGSSSSSTSAAHTPVLTPAPVPSGSNPWGITQSATPILTAGVVKTTSSPAFPTLGEATQAQSVGGSSGHSHNNGGNQGKAKKNSEKTYIDPYDPLSTAVRFIDETIKSLSNYQTRTYKLRDNVLDDETYNSYPSLFSFENIDVSEKSDNVLANRLVDMLAIKPVDHTASLLPYVQTTPQINPRILQQVQQQQQQLQQQHIQLAKKQQQQNRPEHPTPPGMTPQLLQAQLQQQRAVNTPPPPGIFASSNGPIAAPQMTTNGSNSSDLLNQLINGKKVTASM